tara:strand:+ start:752 stop:1546 length:795 start_codon:yes stop_codon:yes gene_type:complete
MSARLDAYVDEETVNGERKRYDRIGAQNSRKRTERKGATNLQDPTLDNRWAYHASYDIGNLLDKKDAKNLGSLVLPTSDYVKSHAMAYHRDCDDVAWGAALNPVMTGEQGSTSTVLPASQQIANGSVGLTLAKLIEANEILEDAELEDGTDKVLVVTKKQLTDLLNMTEVKNSDYNTVKALASGEVDYFMGFHFVKVARLPLVGTTRSCVAWYKGAIQRIKGSMEADVSIRKDLSYATQIYSCWDLGATRRYDEGVVQIDCTEA